MSLICCNNKNECSYLAVIAGVIIGIITGFLTYTAVITATPAFLWVLFGIAIVYLPIILIVSAFTNKLGTRSCICSCLPILLTGILGTILTSLILLGVGFAATSVVGAVITGLLLTFFSITVASVACLSYCTAKCLSSCDD